MAPPTTEDQTVQFLYVLKGAAESKLSPANSINDLREAGLNHCEKEDFRK